MRRSQWILVGIVVVLAVVAYFVMRQPGEVSSSGTLGIVLVEFDSAAVDRMEIRAAAGTVVLEKEGNGWMITSPIRYKADEGAATALLSQSKHLELTSLVSTNPEKRGVFAVDSAGTFVRLMEKGAERTAFRVGKATTTYTETYVRRENANEVYAASGAIAGIFVKTPKEWRDKLIIKSRPETITQVKFRYGDTTFTLAFRDSTWFVDDDSVNVHAVRTFLEALGTFQTEEFVDTTVANLPPVMAVVEVEGTQIRFRYSKEIGRYYVETSVSPQLYIMSSWRAMQILKRKSELAAPRP
jgi:hypothetical protein